MEPGLDNEDKPTPSYRAGELVRTARIAAGVDLAKLSATLRISTAALEALEAGEYDRLPGDPYVRALLGSIARHLNLDAAKVLQTYNAEVGTKSAEVPVRPYKDVSQIHLLAHKKWFVALLVILLLALLFIFGKINSSSDRSDVPVATPLRSDTSATLAAPVDSGSDSKSLQPDSLNGKLDTSSKSMIKHDTTHTVVAASRPDTTHKVTVKQVSTKSRDSATAASSNRISVKPLVDSVWMRVLRKGKPEEVVLLRTSNPPVDVAHSDTIVLILGKRRSVEVAFADTMLIPVKKRFKLIGKKIIYF